MGIFHIHAGYLKPEYAAIVVDYDTDEVLHEDAADELRHPSSLTKKMALYLVFKALREGKLTFKTTLSTSAHAAHQEPTKLGLRVGQMISVADIVKGMIVKSANDAAVVVAEALYGSESAFAHAMTLEAKRLGMEKTIFKNASGLPNPLQVTTAREMAILARALIRDFPEYYGLFNTTLFSFQGKELRNHNRLLGKVDGIDGIKTGFTCASGFNISTSAIRDNRRIIAIVLGGPSIYWRNNRVKDLISISFNKIGVTEGSCEYPPAKLSTPTLSTLISTHTSKKSKLHKPLKSYKVKKKKKQQKKQASIEKIIQESV